MYNTKPIRYKITKALLTFVTSFTVLCFVNCENNTSPSTDYEAPRNLTAEMVSMDVALNWEPSLSGEEIGYEIWRINALDEYTLIATVGAGVTSYTDFTAPLNNTIRYKIATLYIDERGILGSEAEVYTLFGLWATVEFKQYGSWYFKLVKYNPKTGAPISLSGQLPYIATGITRDGETLWVSCYSWHKLFRIDPTTFSIIDTIPSPGDYPMGLAWDGEYLWNADCDGMGNGGTIYKLNPESGDIIDSFDYQSDLRGMTYDGDSIWVSGGLGRVLYKLNPSNGNIEKEIDIGAEAYGLGWDGTYLWLSSNDGSYISRIDRDTGGRNWSFHEPCGPHWDLTIIN